MKNILSIGLLSLALLISSVATSFWTLVEKPLEKAFTICKGNIELD